MTQAVEQTERGKAVVHALRVLAHTSQVDPDFMARCVEAARADVTPGFGSLLEQNDAEFGAMLKHIAGCRSALEIGSRYGFSLMWIAAAIRAKSRIVAVDLPYGNHGGMPDPEPMLRGNVKRIADAGHEAHLFLGDSHAPTLVKAVQALGPYDFCFIDGDHSYDGVKADWENYGSHAKIVAFHDIVNNVGCFRLWQEIKAAGYRTVEYTSSLWLGIGIVFKDN